MSVTVYKLLNRDYIGFELLTMCGIYGVLSKKKQLAKGSIENINRLFQQHMGHRGPDDTGYYSCSDNRLLLGHLRLSIIDIDNGKQPMHSPDGNVVVFNGEIYNFLDLKDRSDYPFSTSSDTEIILSEYSNQGSLFCNYLNGMYGIALYDSTLNLLKLAVDPLGIKSIYYFENEEYLVFSSELVPLCKVLQEALSISLEPDENSTLEYLYHGMFLSEKTPVQGVKKILPGNILTFNFDDNFSCLEKIKFQMTISRENELTDVVTFAVQRQLIADVPLCLFLSGGIDSSLLAVALARKSVDIKCYSFAFDESEVNESEHAKTLANELGLECELVYMKPSELVDAFKDGVYNMDEPISDFATIPLVKLAQKASKEYKICLLGDGGDELFYGYTHHRFWSNKIIFASKFAKFLNAPRFLDYFSYKFENSKIGFLKKMALLAKLSTPFSSSYGPFSNCSFLLKRNIENQVFLASYDSLLNWERINSLSRKLLQKTDRITMREGLEARVPLLDLELLSYSKRYRRKDCIKKGKGKQPLRALLESFFPSETVYRKKQGFRTPAAEWLKGSLGRGIYKTLLECKVIELVISKENIGLLFDDHESNKKDNSSRILSLYALAVFWNKLNIQSAN